MTVVKSREDLRLPLHLRQNLLTFAAKRRVSKIMRHGGLSTVCEEARCPNIGECFANNTATFMIMGDRCTRRCHFCAVTTKKPLPLNEEEPIAVARAALAMGLSYVVITSVDRDELPDGGAAHFVKVIESVKELVPKVRIELLTPDFKGHHEHVRVVLESPIDVFGHNIESVPRLYKSLRPQSDFSRSAALLGYAAGYKNITLKSGLMVGVGETDDEVLETLDLLHSLGVQIVTIGQYLRPSLKHWPVDRYVSPASFKAFADYARRIGIAQVFCGPLVRSSYHAAENHRELSVKVPMSG